MQILTRDGKIKDISVNELIERILKQVSYREDVQKILEQTKSKKPRLSIFELIKKVKAIIIKIVCNINSTPQSTHYIDKNILLQTTYYKTLTKRP